MKKFIEWRNTWSVGVDAIDRQHQQIAVIFNNIVEIYLDSDSEQTDPEKRAYQIHEMFMIFDAKIREHFHDEEELMQLTNYPGCTEHSREHLMLLAELKHYIMHIETVRDVINLATLKSLKAWFFSHIISSDKKLAEYLNLQDEENARNNMCDIPAS